MIPVYAWICFWHTETSCCWNFLHCMYRNMPKCQLPAQPVTIYIWQKCVAKHFVIVGNGSLQKAKASKTRCLLPVRFACILKLVAKSCVHYCSKSTEFHVSNPFTIILDGHESIHDIISAVVGQQEYFSAMGFPQVRTNSPVYGSFIISFSQIQTVLFKCN